MSLFGNKNKKVKDSCCCGSSCDEQSMEKAIAEQSEGVFIKVLGSGCSKCRELENNTKIALEQLGMDTTIEHITDFTQIASYGIMTTPALVVGGNVVSFGKVLKVEEIIKLLQKIL